MQNAQDLTDLSDYIDRATLSMVNTGRLDLDALNTDSEQSSALLAAIAPELVNTLRARPVTGIFVVLNTEDLRLLDVGSGVPGIYLQGSGPGRPPFGGECRPADRARQRGGGQGAGHHHR